MSCRAKTEPTNGRPKTWLNWDIRSGKDQKNYQAAEKNKPLLLFRFVVGASGAAVVNIILVAIATSEKETETVIPVLEEKTNGAIMLY